MKMDIASKSQNIFASLQNALIANGPRVIILSILLQKKSSYDMTGSFTKWLLHWSLLTWLVRLAASPFGSVSAGV